MFSDSTMRRSTFSLGFWLGPILFPALQGQPIRSGPRRLFNGTGFITLEEHWISPAFLGLYTNSTSSDSLAPIITNVGTDRIAALDAGGIDIQVISHAPLNDPRAMFMSDTVTQANTELAAAVAKFPDRLRGLCMLAMGIPDAAATELRRCVTELGFNGALVSVRPVIMTPPSKNAVAVSLLQMLDLVWLGHFTRVNTRG